MGRRCHMRPSGSPEALERRRFKAMDLLEDGLQPVEVAKKLKVDRRSVRRWKAAFRSQGPKAIEAKSSSGRPPKLDKQAKKDLEKNLLQGAKAAGFQTDLWTCPRVAKLIQSSFGVRYHVDHIGRLLHSLGWSPQKPQRKAVERNEEQIQQWIKVDWPRIKKKHRG
jgi:transposase